MTPRDFLEEDYPVQSASKPRDFLETGEAPESLAQSGFYAPFRVAEDVGKALYRGAESIPDYLQSAKTEVPGVFSSLWNHPGRSAAQLGAGVTELGHNLINTPRGLADYAANRLNLIPQSWASSIPYQREISQDVNSVFGEPQYEGEKLIRGIGRNALNIAGGAKLASALNPMNLTAKSIAKDIVKTREKNIGSYGKRYEGLWNEAKGRGLEDALYNVNIDLPTIKKYSPSKGIKGIVDFNENPTLETAHAAKSDLLRIKRDLDKLTTLRTAERQQLGAVNDAIDSINNNMFRDASGKLNKPLYDKYQALQEGYKGDVIPYKNKAINEFLRGESTPQEMVNALSRKSFYAKKGSAHKALKLRKTLKSHPYLTGIGAGSLIGGAGRGLYDELFGQ